MRDFFKSGKFKVLVVLMLLIIGIIVYSLTKGGYASDSSSFISVIFEPFQKLSTGISSGVYEKLDTLINAQKYYDENKQLKEKLNQVYNDIIDYDKLKRENSELREMLALKQQHSDIVVSPPCSVIARTANDPYFSFTIDKGSNDGVSPYDPVVTSEGIVGICFDVSMTTSRVQTLYSPKTAVGVTTVRTKSTGILEGDYELAKRGLCRMSYIDKTSDIKEGDVVMTTGSGTFPEGQLIGTVTETGIEDSGLSRYAIIKPAVEPKNAATVFVITEFNGQDK